MTNSILARRTAALEEDRQDMPPPCIDWVGAVAPDGATIDASSSAPLLLSHHPDWASWLSTLDSRPPPAILILADPPPADAAMFLDWLAERGVVIGITSGLARELQPPPSWMRDIRLLVTDHRPVQIEALAPSARIDWLGEGPPPTVPNDCHAEPATDLMQVLRRARLRLRAQWAVDRWHTEQLAAERPFASIEPLARAPGSAPSTSTPMPPRRNWRSQLFERAVRLAQQPVIGPPLRWLWAITQSTHTYHGILRVQPQLQQLLGEQIQLLQQGHHQQLQLDQLSQQLQERLADIDQRLIQDAERQLQMNQLVQQLGNEQTAVLGLLRQLEQTQERLQGQIEQQAHTLQQQEEQQAQHEQTWQQLHLPTGALPALLSLPLPDQLATARAFLEQTGQSPVPVDLADTDLSQFWLGALGGAHGDEVRRQQYQSYQPILLPLDGPVLDIGCGSGDWLAYLAEQGETAIGIDNNPHEIARCRARGLHAEQADAFEWLQAHTRQYAAITLMQVIEHVPRPRLGELLAAISAALRPGGLLLMETVNPAHPLALSVFYNDPTHQRPLPVEYLGFLCQSVGLRPQQTLYTYPLEVAVTAAHWQTPHYMNYALLLRKP